MSSEDSTEPSLSDYEQAVSSREQDASKRMRIGIGSVVLSVLFAFGSVALFVIFLRAGLGLLSLLPLVGLWVPYALVVPGVRLIRGPYTNI